MSRKKVITIPLSKKKIISELWKVVPITILTVILVLRLVIINKGQHIFLDVMNALVCLFLLYISFLYIKKLRDDSPGLIINPHGIAFNLPHSQFGLISWDDIQKITIKRILHERFLGIKIINPEKYLKRGLLVSRLFYNLMPRYYRTLVYISPNVLDISFDGLVELINKYYENHVNA